VKLLIQIRATVVDGIARGGRYERTDAEGGPIDAGAESAIAASGTLERDIEPGTHSIRLTGMAANCTARPARTH
jgi:hypothetical protein